MHRGKGTSLALLHMQRAGPLQFLVLLFPICCSKCLFENNHLGGTGIASFGTELSKEEMERATEEEQYECSKPSDVMYQEILFTKGL